MMFIRTKYEFGFNSATFDAAQAYSILFGVGYVFLMLLYALRLGAKFEHPATL